MRQIRSLPEQSDLSLSDLVQTSEFALFFIVYRYSHVFTCSRRPGTGKQRGFKQTSEDPYRSSFRKNGTFTNLRVVYLDDEHVC